MKLNNIKYFLSFGVLNYKVTFFSLFYLKTSKICISNSEKDRQTFSMTEFLCNIKIKARPKSGLRKIVLRLPPTGALQKNFKKKLSSNLQKTRATESFTKKDSNSGVFLRILWIVQNCHSFGHQLCLSCQQYNTDLNTRFSSIKKNFDS